MGQRSCSVKGKTPQKVLLRLQDEGYLDARAIELLRILADLATANAAYVAVVVATPGLFASSAVYTPFEIDRGIDGIWLTLKRHWMSKDWRDKQHPLFDAPHRKADRHNATIGQMMAEDGVL
jgi:hypothetical protein